MTEIDIDMPDRDDPPRAIARVERVMRDAGLRQVSRGTLKSYAGSTHWHYKRGDEPGTLEITLHPSKQRVWFKVQVGRRAPWIDELIPQLKAELEKRKSPGS